ncbi:glucosaminidase domain-containing protein [Oceanibaculum pacificum]|uniref:Mannosyl-glycoprotein endo-beta-N-acetylglucosamidase-like domain-containing protein n=1 Tax=Oceanibaculum pacificum TaxID=580166 RepID=A0A154VSC6_9PROT|nr:glucosaminidase domain-containing protein [Oceanibaculum pacificum]KZD04212.1 hypothetical protein AUP43_12410 [Oceanibaculum pacificum]
MRKPSFVNISLCLLGASVIALQATAILAGPTLPYPKMMQAMVAPLPDSIRAVLSGPAKIAAALPDAASGTPHGAVAIPVSSAPTPVYRPAPRVKLFNGKGPVHVPGTMRSINQSSEAALLFDIIGYDLTAVREGVQDVPRLFLASVPADLRKLTQIEERKRLFLKTMLPLILRVNEEVGEDRRALLSIKARRESGLQPRWEERALLARLSTLYGVEDGDLGALLLRVDAVPVSLALAQSIEESGWGTSRVARQGNALFGQYAWKDSHGLVQQNRKPGETHVIRSFDKLIDAVAAYSLNLNSHAAYADFRKARAELRQQGKPLDGYRLAGHLLRYSERGPDYIRTLRIIMKGNQLAELEQAELAHGISVATTRDSDTTLSGGPSDPLNEG